MPTSFVGVVESLPVRWWWRLGDTGSVAEDSFATADGTHLGPYLGGGVYDSSTGYVNPTTGMVSNDPDGAMNYAGGKTQIPYSAWMQDPWSAHVFIKPDSVAGTHTILARYDGFAHGSFGPSEFSLRLDGTTLALYLFQGAGSFVTLTVPGLVAGGEYAIVVEYDKTTAKIYVNGTLATSATQTANTSIYDLTIGGLCEFTEGEKFSGLIDEVVWFDGFLSDTEVADLYTAFTTGDAPGAGGDEIALGAASETDDAYALTVIEDVTVDLGTADETDEALALSVELEDTSQTVELGLASEDDTAQPVSVIGAATIPLGVASEVDAAHAMSPIGPVTIPLAKAAETDTAHALTVDDGSEPTRVFLGKAVESEEALEIQPVVQTIAGILQPEEQEIALPISARLNGGAGNRLGIAVEQEQARPVRHGAPTGVVTTGTIQMLVWSGPTGSISGTSTLVLDILEREPLQAPTSILVAVTGALPRRVLNFFIDGVLVDSVNAGDGSGFEMFSVPVPEAQGRRGEHVLLVDQSGAASASAIFTLRYDPDLLPTNQGPDAPPVEIPESIHPSGVRRWVLQDLMPGGLGSYVMPLNPTEMDNPSFERVLTSVHSTAVNEGQVHVSEGSVRPLEWSFKGYCPTQEMAETLRAYAELRRRFYIHDHRGRVWIVVVTQAEIVPRLQQRNIYDELTDWVHDYTVNAVIFDRAEF